MHILRRWWSLALLVPIAACTHAPPPPPANALALELRDAPEWVRGDCRAYYKNSKDIACAVGSIGGTTNLSIARTGAEARARTALARGLQTQVKAMVKDYQATVTGGDQFNRAAADEQYVADVSKQITQQTLSGTRIDASWISSQGTYFALISLDVEAFRQALEKMTTLDESIRRAVVARADRAFRELDEVTARQADDESP
jgi:hypothetical protein